MKEETNVIYLHRYILLENIKRVEIERHEDNFNNKNFH